MKFQFEVQGFNEQGALFVGRFALLSDAKRVENHLKNSRIVADGRVAVDHVENLGVLERRLTAYYKSLKVKDDAQRAERATRKKPDGTVRRKKAPKANG